MGFFFPKKPASRLAVLKRYSLAAVWLVVVLLFNSWPHVMYYVEKLPQCVCSTLAAWLLPVLVAATVFSTWRRQFLRDQLAPRTKATLLNQGTSVSVRLTVFLDNARHFGTEWKVNSTQIQVLISHNVMAAARGCPNYTGLCTRDAAGNWYFEIDFSLNAAEAAALKAKQFPLFPHVDLTDIVIDTNHCRIEGKETGIALE